MDPLVIQNSARQELEVGDSEVTGLREFVDELENRILDVNDKLFFKEIRLPIPDNFPNYGLDIRTIFDILDENGQPAFQLAKCDPKKNKYNFIISNNAGHAVISLTRNGYFVPRYLVEGGGILSFSQVRNCRGYSLQDPYKSLLAIRTGWIPFLPFLLLIPQISATMAVVNLDDSPTGTLFYKKWSNLSLISQDRSLGLHFIRGLDRKAKYMLFAACLLPLSDYFSEPGRLRLSVYSIIFYVIFLLAIGVITSVLFQL